MSNTNNNLQTQTSNALHNAIMEAGAKDRPPMLAPSNYVQWKSRIKRYINTKPNNELIHYCLQNPPYKFKWTEETVPVSEGSSETTIEEYVENYKNVSQDIRDQLNVEAKVVQIILTWIDNDIYSTVDACPKYEKQLKGCKIYKPTNNNLRTSSNTSKANQDNTLRINRGTGYDNQRVVNETGARENVGTQVELEAHYLYMAQIHKVTPDAADNFGHVFDVDHCKRTKMPMAVPISTRDPIGTMNQSVATPLKRTVAAKSTNQKPRSTIRKQYEQISKTCKWWYYKFTPSRYKWKPKSPIGNANTNVSMPLENASRTANILEHMTPRCSTVSNTPLYSSYFAAQRDNSIHRHLWVLKAHDGKSQASNIGNPMATKHLDADLSGTSIDRTKYHSMVGALMHLTASRPDIVHATCYCARYQARPTEKHLTMVKRIFCFFDSNHAGCLDLRKSTSGGIQFLGGDKLVSWSSKKQDCTSMSSAKVEYVSLSTCCAQVLWLKTQLTYYGFHFDKIPIYHFIKEQVKKGIVELFFVRIEYQLADLFTKALPEDRFKYLVRRLGMRCFTPEELEEEHLRCCQAKGLKVKEKLVHLMMVVKFKVLIAKKKMCSLDLMRFLMVHLEELEMKKLLYEKVWW
nr:hypothetical protein [Tanacetum cinerariifolium]